MHVQAPRGGHGGARHTHELTGDQDINALQSEIILIGVLGGSTRIIKQVYQVSKYRYEALACLRFTKVNLKD